MHDLNDLHYFAQVVEHQGFAPASRALHVPRSKLSRRVALLEVELGVRLIQRSSRHFLVTGVGQEFYRHCQAMLVEANAADEAIALRRVERRGVVCASCPIALVQARVGGTLIVLTGASGAGKTTLAAGIQKMRLQNLKVLFFDSIGIPSVAELDAFGTGYQPGGTWQRQATMDWVDRIAGMLRTGESVLFEGQMRIAFIQEAIAASRLANVRILLIDCVDDCRISRLTDRGQQHLANLDMMNWSEYLRAESQERGCEILDTGLLTLAECLERLKSYLWVAPSKTAPLPKRTYAVARLRAAHGGRSTSGFAVHTAVIRGTCLGIAIRLQPSDPLGFNLLRDSSCGQVRIHQSHELSLKPV